MKYNAEYWKDVSKVISNIPNVDKLYGKKILITGATGMVCSPVVEIFAYLNKVENADIQILLAARNKERLVKRFEDVLSDGEYTFIEYDATKIQNINTEVDYVIHGASNANPAVFAKEPVETLLGCIYGLNSILELAKNNEGSRILYISSSEIYGNRTKQSNEPYLENEYGFLDILNPRASYPSGKRAAETLCSTYAQEFGIDFVIVRPGHIYGPSITLTDSRASAAFTRDAIAGRNIVMKSDGSQLRSYCYTLDSASAILTVLLNGESSNAYNISNRNSVCSIRDIAEALAKAGNVNVIYENPSDIEKKSYNLMDNSALNGEKLERLGWKAAFNLEQGTKATIEYYEAL